MRKFAISCCVIAAELFQAINAAVPQYDPQTALVNAKADIPNWMSYLPDDVYVAHVSIPGTHDAATGHEWDSSLGPTASTTQNTTLSQQLEGGIRAFDFRPGLKPGTDYLVCAHGSTYLKLRLDEAFKILSDFLDAHPSEFFVIHLFRGNIARPGEGSSTKAQRDTYNELIDQIFNKGEFNKYLIDYAPDLKVKDIRGKIVVFRRDKIDFAHIEKAGNLTNWPGDEDQWNPNNYVTAVNATYPSTRGSIYVTDVSSPQKEQLDIEISSITDLYNFSTTQPYPNNARKQGLYKPFWVMCFTSGEYAGSGTKAYLNNAINTNPHLTNLIKTSENKGPVGIVFSDWVLTQKHTYKDVEYDVLGTDLVNAIIENNFSYIDKFILDDQLFTPIEAKNNWDDTKQYFVRNVGTGLLLSSGATWGTHGTLSTYGIHVTPCYDKFTDTYMLATTLGNGYVGTDGNKTFFIDFAPATEFKVEKVADNDNAYTFNFTLDGNLKSMTAEAVTNWIDGTKYMIEPRDIDSGNPLQQWELIQVDDYFNELIANGNNKDGIDLSDMIPGHHFWPNDKNNWTGATDSYCSISHEGIDQWTDKDLVLHCHNKKTTAASLVKKTKWVIEKTFTGFPAGFYNITFHAAELNLKDKESFTFTINNESVKNQINTANSNSASDAINIFREKSADYTVSHDFTIGEAGTLKFYITNGEIRGTEACLFIDNIYLTYYGKDNPSGIGEVTAADNGLVDVYNISGIKVADQVNEADALNNLSAGLYIIRTATTAYKAIKK